MFACWTHEYHKRSEQLYSNSYGKVIQESAQRERANILAAIKGRFGKDWAFTTSLERMKFIT